MKYPPGVLHVKKLLKQDSSLGSTRLFSREVKNYMRDSILNNYYDSGNHLFLFAFDEFRKNQLDLIHYLDTVDSGNQLWSSLYYEKPVDSFMEFFPDSILSFLGGMKIPDKTKFLISHLSELVQSLHGNRVRLKFTDPFVTDMMQKEIDYQLVFYMDQNYYYQPTKIHLPESITLKVYKQQVLHKADFLKKQKQYPQALNYLWKRYKKTPLPIIRDKSREVFLLWSRPLNKGCCLDIDSLFNRAENRWHFSTDMLWYKKLKGDMLSSCYQCLKNRDAPLEKRLAVITRLRNIQGKPEIEREFYITEGLLAFEQSRYWQSAYYLKMVHPRDDHLQKALEQALSNAFESSFQEKDYLTIFESGSDFSELFSSSLSLRYMYGQSCAALNRYREAAQHFEWLLDNWQSSSNLEVELDTLYSRLQNLYKYAMNFKSAGELDKLNYKRNKKSKDLYGYLGNLRARYFKPLINILPDFIHKQNHDQIEYLFNEYPINYHPFILGIYLHSHSSRRLQIFFKRNNIIPPTQLQIERLQHFPAYLEREKKKEFFLINRLGQDVFVILHLDKSLNDKESVFFANIIKNPNHLGHWRDLVNYEQSICLKTLTQCISGMIETEMRHDHWNSITPYWSVLEEMDLLLYMVLHGKNGEILEHKGFQREQASYKNYQYIKSAKTMAFYQQTIQYREIRVYDMSNPIFKKNGWYASLRMGFRKE